MAIDTAGAEAGVLDSGDGTSGSDTAVMVRPAKAAVMARRV